jgi:hypothetical protein
VEASHFRVLDLSKEHVFEPTRVILSLPAIQTKPDLIQLLTEFILVRWGETFLDEIADTMKR